MTILERRKRIAMLSFQRRQEEFLLERSGDIVILLHYKKGDECRPGEEGMLGSGKWRELPLGGFCFLCEVDEMIT